MGGGFDQDHLDRQGRFTKARQSCDVTHSSAKRYDVLIRLRFSFHLRYAFRQDHLDRQGRFTKARQSCDVTHSSAKRYDALIRLRFSFHLRYAFRPTIKARYRYFLNYNEKKLNVFKLVISYLIVSM